MDSVRLSQATPRARPQHAGALCGSPSGELDGSWESRCSCSRPAACGECLLPRPPFPPRPAEDLSGVSSRAGLLRHPGEAEAFWGQRCDPRLFFQVTTWLPTSQPVTRSPLMLAAHNALGPGRRSPGPLSRSRWMTLY